MNGPLLSRREAATALGVSLTTIMRLISRGELQAVKVGRLTRVPPASVDAFVQGCPSVATTPRKGKSTGKTTGLDGAV